MLKTVATNSENLTFRRARRLSGRKAFSRVFGTRSSAANRYLVVYAAPNGLAFTRLGLSVGRRFGPAVARNRAKRLLREAYRLEQNRLAAGFDLVCVPRPGPPATLDLMRRAIRTVSQRAILRYQTGQIQ